MKTDIFISYRRKNYGSLAARAIYERLVNEGYQVFLDIENLEGGEFWPQIEGNIRESNDVIVVFPRDCFAEGDDTHVFLKELRLAKSLNLRIIPVFMQGFDYRQTVPQGVETILNMEGIQFSDAFFDANISRLRELLVSAPCRIPVLAHTADYFNEETKNEADFITKAKVYPVALRERMKTILPLFSGIPCFTMEQSVETTLSAPEYYLSFPDDLLDAIAYSKSKFSPVDVNLDRYLERLALSEERQRAFLTLLEKARRDVANEFIGRRNGHFFNGGKYGIWSSDSYGRTADSSENPILHLDLYNTDYFTQQTMFRLFRFLCAEGEWNDLTARRKDSLNRLSIFRNSLGISLIVEIPSERSIILTNRSQNAAYSDGKEWIYPSVTESVSETDYQRYSGLVELDLCVRRGLLEELGITSRYYDPETIQYFSMFHETFFSQDGLTASVRLRDNVQSRQIQVLRGKDSELEMTNLLFLRLDSTEIRTFIINHLEAIRPQALFTLLEYLSAKGINLGWNDESDFVS